MSNELLAKLEGSIDRAIEAIELMRMQIEELEDQQQSLSQENHLLLEKHQAWESTLSSMLQKLSNVDTSNVNNTIEAKEESFIES